MTMMMIIITIIESRQYIVISEILMEVNKRITGFSNMTPYNLVNRHQCTLRPSGILRRLGGNSVPTFRYKVSVPFSSSKGGEVQVLDFLAAEAGTDWMSRNVGTELPLDVA
jgi:hypothetical protein